MPSTAAAGRRYLPVAAAIAAAAIVAMASFLGCQDTNRSPRSQQVGTAQSREQMNTQNLLYAFSVLRGIDEGQTQKSLHTVVDRLNQWSQHKEPLPDWTPDALVAELPKELHDLNSVRHLDELTFVQTDGRDLQQTVWLSAIADRARGEDSAALATAQSLFDWVVRNIQLERDGAIEVPHLPGETLLFGRGTAADRAWIFALLARQQRLDVVMLALPSKEASAEPRLWLPALFLDGELYLFDTRLGLPIPGPDGKPVATLNDVLADEKLLRNLDVDEQRRYPVAAGDLERVAVLVEGSPMYLSERMRLVEAELPGKESLVITTRPAALSERIKSHPHVESVRLWELPYERIRSIANPDARKKTEQELKPFIEPIPVLWQARVLHLLGQFDGDKGASARYQQAREADADMKVFQEKAPAKDRPTVDSMIELLKVAKQDASYWLGLVAFERRNFPAAADYLKTRTLTASPDGPWTAGARYNLGRVYEAQGKIDEAILMYQADRSAQRTGNLLRARRLEKAAKAGAAKDAAG